MTRQERKDLRRDARYVACRQVGLYFGPVSTPNATETVTVFTPAHNESSHSEQIIPVTWQITENRDAIVRGIV